MCFAIVATTNNFDRSSRAEKTAVRDQCVLWNVSGILFECNDIRTEKKTCLKSAWSTWALHVKIGWCAHVAEPERSRFLLSIKLSGKILCGAMGWLPKVELMIQANLILEVVPLWTMTVSSKCTDSCSHGMDAGVRIMKASNTSSS